MPETEKHMYLRLPADLKTWIEQEAERDERPQNSVVVRALRQVKQRAELAQVR